MFKEARIKLTAFYLVIIMTITVFFSLFIYRNLTLELARSLRVQAWRAIPKEDLDRIRPDYRFFPRREYFRGDRLEISAENYRQIYNEAQKRIILKLVLVNLVVLFFSGAGGYFLASKTLQPINEVLEKQKRFIGDASHELRTPLAAMKTELEVALRNKKIDLKTARKFLKSSLEETNKMQLLTDRLLILEKYQDAGVLIKKEELDLAKVAESVIKRIFPLVQKRKFY